MIQAHNTWNIIDSSKLQEFMNCPRKYFYRYMLGWAGEGKNIHLIFGEAWHRALEVLMRKGYSGDSIKEGMEQFTEYYRRYYEPYEDEFNRPKNPGYALDGLIDYVTHYQNDKFEVIHTEVHGTIPLDDTRLLTGRIDSICRDERGYFVLEHKTGSSLTAAWSGQWTLKVQIGTYLHALYCMYPPEAIYGLIVNGVFFLKTMFKYERVIIRKMPNAMQAWMDMALYYYKQIEVETERLIEEQVEDNETMVSFPMNTESCTKYNKMCMYADLCTTWNNPLQRCDSCPLGFVEKWWNPAESDKDSVKMEKGKIIE